MTVGSVALGVELPVQRKPNEPVMQPWRAKSGLQLLDP
jgi:hypothetical protein